MIQSSGKTAKRKPHRSLGLEITDRVLKLCELHERRGRRPKVTHYGAAELPTGVIEDGRIRNPNLFQQALDKLVRQRDIKSNRIYVTVPSSLVMARTLQLPDLGSKELRRVVQYEMKNNLQVAFDNPYYDFVKLSPVSSDENDTENVLPDFPNRNDEVAAASEKQRNAKLGNVLVVAAPRTELNHYVDALYAVKLKPQSIEIASLSLLRLCERLSFGQIGLHLLVNIGLYASEITIFEDGVFRMTRQIEVEFPNVQQSSDSKPYEEKAADLNWFDQFSDPGQQFHQAARELVAEIERIMDFYYYTIVNQRGHVFKKIWVAGDLPELADIIVQMQQQYSMEVASVYWDALIVPNRDQGWRMGEYAVPLGLALRGGER